MSDLQKMSIFTKRTITRGIQTFQVIQSYNIPHFSVTYSFMSNIFVFLIKTVSFEQEQQKTTSLELTVGKFRLNYGVKNQKTNRKVSLSASPRPLQSQNCQWQIMKTYKSVLCVNYLQHSYLTCYQSFNIIHAPVVARETFQALEKFSHPFNLSQGQDHKSCQAKRHL